MSAKKFQFSKAALRRMYLEQGYSCAQIARIHRKVFGIKVARTTVHLRLQKWHIRRDMPQDLVIQRSWDKKIFKVDRPGHPCADYAGRVPLHILVVEKKYQVFYERSKHRVRFLDGNPLNVRPENLELITLKRKSPIERHVKQLSKRLWMNHLDLAKKKMRSVPYHHKRAVMNKMVRNLLSRSKDRELKVVEREFLSWLTCARIGMRLTRQMHELIPKELWRAKPIKGRKRKPGPRKKRKKRKRRRRKAQPVSGLVKVNWHLVDSIRESQGMSKTEMIRRTGVLYQTYFSRLKAPQPITMYRKSIKKVARVLKVKLSEVLDE